MARKGFLWYIFGENKKPLYVNSNGIISEGDENLFKPNGQPAHLEYSPISWQDSLLKYARNIKYWGLQRTFTPGLEFPGDGFLILRKIMWTLGYEGKAYLGVLKLNRLDLPYKYEGWYFAELDFSKYKESKTTVKIEAIDGGIATLFKAFETNIYEIDIDEDPEAVYVEMDGIRLEMKQDYSYLDTKWGGDEFYQSAFTIPVARKNPDGLAPYVVLQDSFIDAATVLGGDFYDYLATSDNWFAKVKEEAPNNIELHISGRVDVTQHKKNSNEGQIHVRIWRIKKDDTGDTIQPIENTYYLPIFNGYILGTDPKYQRFIDGVKMNEITFDFTIDVEPGEKLFYTLEYYPYYQSKRSLYSFDNTSELVVNYSTRYATTYVKGLRPYRMFEKLVEKIIDGAVLFPTDNGLYYKSDWLRLMKDIVLVSGDSLRGLEGSKGQSSIEQFFKSMNFFGASLGTEKGKLFIEKLKYVFSDDVIIDLGEVEGATLDIAQDLLFNKIKTGGPFIEYNDVNGKYEVNQEQRWGTKNVRNNSELDLTTPYRRDSYGAEYTRINLEGKTTTDDEADNTIWMIKVGTSIYDHPNGFAYQKISRPAYSLYTGAPETMFNTELTPKKAILNLGNYIHSILDKQEDRYIELNSADKNVDLVTELVERLAQKESISISNLSSQLFLPYYINFTTKLPLNVLTIMSETPYGKIKFSVNGRIYYGYMMDGGVKPAMNDKQTWKLLSTVDNNFINFYKK